MNIFGNMVYQSAWFEPSFDRCKISLDNNLKVFQVESIFRALTVKAFTNVSRS
jgi:hypothetical protein